MIYIAQRANVQEHSTNEYITNSGGKFFKISSDMIILHKTNEIFLHFSDAQCKHRLPPSINVRYFWVNGGRD